MKIVTYCDEYSERLCAALRLARAAPLLQFTPYVRHHYLGHPSAHLQLLLDGDGRVLATLGTESVPMRILGVRYSVAVASNTYSLERGALAFLVREWMKRNTVGAILPQTWRWREMVGRQDRWHALPGLKTWYFNWDYPPVDGEPSWKRLARPAARFLTRNDPARRIRHMPSAGLEVEETNSVGEDMVPGHSPFDLRTEFSADVLNWRFSTRLDYVRYRIFRISRSGRARGLAVLAEWPHRVVVSYLDGEDAADLAHGVLLAIAAVNHGEARFRQVALTSMDSTMNAAFREFGFRSTDRDEPFYLAAFGSTPLPLPVSGRCIVPIELGDQGIGLGLLGADSRLRPEAAARACA